MARGITSLRYLKRQRLESEQQLQRGWFRELIHSYGADTTYYRHDATPYEEPSAFNYDYAYGEKANTSFWLSAPIVVFMESMGDAAILNKFGIETDGDMDAFILIDDFTEQFRDTIGTAQGEMFTNVTLTGCLSAGEGIITASFSDGDFKAFTSAYVSGYTAATISGTSGVVSALWDEPIYRTPKLFHDQIYKSESYDTRRIDGSLSGSWGGTLDVSGTGNVSGVISGSLVYINEDPGKNGGPHWNIAPQVGDFFRLDFHDDNHEEYEITRLIDRNLQSDNGMTHLLDKYVWHMNCVRRDASYENVIGDQLEGIAEEEHTRSKIESNFRLEDESNEVFNYELSAIDEWDGPDAEDVYGAYGIDEDVDNINVP
jgi:hypothetical protein